MVSLWWYPEGCGIGVSGANYKRTWGVLVVYLQDI